MTIITWDPSNKTAAVVLSNSNLTATFSGGSTWINVFATQSYSTGQFYLEINLVGTAADIIIGVVNASQSLVAGNYIGSNAATGLGYEPNNNVVYPGGTSPGQGVIGNVIGVKYDFGAKLIQFNINGGTFSTATSFSAITGPYFPGLSIFAAGSVSTVNFGQIGYTYSLPTGYGPFSTTGPSTLISHTSITGSTGGTTPNISTIGSTLLVINASYTSPSVPPPTDNLNNTWIPLTPQTYSSTQYNQLFYAVRPILSANHNFTTTALTSAIEVAAFVGPISLDQQSGSQGTTNPIHPGNITSSKSGSLFVSGLNFGAANVVSIGNSFTITDQNNFSTGVNYGGALAYLSQSANVIVDPSWTFGTGGASSTMASFLYGNFVQPNLSASKFIEYDVLSVPAALDASKFVQYDILSVPAALDASKVLQYVILELPPIILSNRKTANFAAFFQNKSPKRRLIQASVSVGNRRIYAFMMT